MFATGVEDLAKPQWVKTLRAMDVEGGMTINQLAGALDVSYMAAKQYCEDLTRLGYLVRIRTPRTSVGRPEIFYRLSEKVGTLFPGVGMDFSLETLEIARQLYGENAPERILFQYFESLRVESMAAVHDIAHPHDRAETLAALRRSRGIACTFDPAGGEFPRLMERHHPMDALFRKYPAAISMDLRGIAEAVGTRVERVECKVGTSVVAIELRFPDMPEAPACRE